MRIPFALLLLALSVGFDWPARRQELIDRIHSPEASARLDACELLASRPPEETVSELLHSLDDRVPEVRLCAARVAVRIPSPALIAALTRWLTESDPKLRVATVELLAEAGSISSVPPLLRALHDPDATVRHSAALALGRLWRFEAKEQIVEAVAGCLDDTQSQVRVVAVQVLRNTHDPRAVLPLVGRLSDPANQVRREAALALGEMGDVHAGAAVLRLLDDTYADVRRAAIIALGELKIERAVDRLSSVSQRGPLPERLAAVQALGMIGGNAAVEWLVRSLTNESTRAAAAMALGKIGKSSTTHLVKLLENPKTDPMVLTEALGAALGKDFPLPPVQTLLRHAVASVRRAAVIALESIGNSSAGVALTESLLDNDREVQRLAAKALGTLRFAPAAQELRPWLRTGDHHLAMAAATALGEMSDKDAISIFLDLLWTGRAHRDVLRAVSDALGLVADSTTAEALANLARTKSGITRKLALRALIGASRRHPHPSAIRLATELLRDEEASIRALAAATLAASRANSSVPMLKNTLSASRQDRRLLAETLSSFTGDQVIAILKQLAEDEDIGVRTHATWALGSNPGPVALAIVTQALDSPYPSIRTAAAGALVRLGDMAVVTPSGDDWTIIELVDELGEPIPDRYYELQLQNGLTKVGWTDAAGLIRAEEFSSGEVTLREPAL